MGNLNGKVRYTQVPAAETEVLRSVPLKLKWFQDTKLLIKIPEKPTFKYTIYFN